jgi:hypothetical protein
MADADPKTVLNSVYRRRDLVDEPEVQVDGDESRTIDEGEKSAKALVQSFIQTVKGYRLYEADHPSPARFLDRLKKDFDHYFDEYDSFSLQVGESHLFYQGKVVYESQDARESVAFIFFKDGIRELRFYKGLEPREILGFLDLVRKSDRVSRMEDDFVTLFWENDFSHIAITTVDDFLEWGGDFIPATEEDLMKGVEYGYFQEEGLSEKIDKVESGTSQGEMVRGLREVLELSSSESLVQACQLTSGEMMEVNREIEEEQKAGNIEGWMDNLIEVLFHLGEDREAHENLISYFERTVEGLLERKDVGRSVAILRALHAAKGSVSVDERQELAIHRILETTSGPHFIELLGKNMRGNGDVDSEPVLQYLRFLTKQAVDPLSRLLVELEPGKWKKFVSDFLAELSQDDIHPLTGFLSDSNPILICHILNILGKTNHPTTVKYLGGLSNHDDPRVREVTLQVLSHFRDRGVSLIQDFLKDPTTEIRSKAALLFARSAGEQAVGPLAGIVFSEGFQKRGYEEKASFVRALGETGSREAVPVLKKIAKRRFWLKGARWNEMRLCAAHTLKTMEVEKGVML